MTAILQAHRRLSMEMIDFQTDNFGEKLEAVFEDIKAKIRTDLKATRDFKVSEQYKKLVGLIKDRTGLNVQIIVNPWMPAAVLPLYSNKHHIFLNKMFRGQNLGLKDQDKFMKENGDEPGTVNTETVKVTGLFAKYPTKVYLNPYFFFRDHDYTAGEVTAVLLHELGHAFHACEYSDRISSTNQILAETVKTMLNFKEGGDVKYIHTELKSINSKATEADIDAMLTGKGKIIGGLKWYEFLIGTVQTQLSNSKYDESSFEQLADNFTTRFGYGRQLVTALDKLSAQEYSKSKTVLWSFYFIETFYMVISLVALAGPFMPPITAAGFLLGTFPALCGGLVLYILAMLSAENNVDYTYDSLVIRYKRVRLQMVEFLKNSELERDEINDTVQSIYAIDDSIKSSNEYNHFLRTMMNFFSPNARAAKKSINEQQFLEELANSDLFIKAALLKASAE
jgi:hypothetical protein